MNYHKQKDQRWMAVALLYGPPTFETMMFKQFNNIRITHFLLNLEFRIVVEKFFDKQEIDTFGWQRLMHDYKQWYGSQSHSV